jgi:rhodanese-related sulfurtransferase
VALQLKKRGIRNIRLLDGGYDAWIHDGFETETLTA